MVTCKNDLSLNSKVWVFQSDKELVKGETELVESTCEKFLQEWNTHGTSLVAKAEVFFDRFLVFFVDEDQVKASGCSLDKMTALVKGFEIKLNNSFFNRLLVAYEDDNSTIKTCPLVIFEEKCESGIFDENTIVYNNLVTNKNEFLNSWKMPIKNSWHSRYLPKVQN